MTNATALPEGLGGVPLTPIGFRHRHGFDRFGDISPTIYLYTLILGYYSYSYANIQFLTGDLKQSLWCFTSARGGDRNCRSIYEDAPSYISRVVDSEIF